MKLVQTETQRMMITKINEAKAELQSRIDALRAKHPNLSPEEFKELGDLQNKMIQLNDQLRKAQQPVNNTPERQAAIEKLIQNIENNAEVSEVSAPENAEAGKKLSAKDEFQYNLTEYVAQMKKSLGEMEEQLDVQQEMVTVLKEHQPNCNEELYKADLNTREDIIANLKVAISVTKKRLEIANKNIIGWTMENFEMLSELNFFINNALKLADYEERVIESSEE